MSEQWDTETETREEMAPHRRFPDPVNLVFGLIALLVAAYALTNDYWWFPSIDPRWAIAGGALVVGLLLLGASLRPHRRR